MITPFITALPFLLSLRCHTMLCHRPALLSIAMPLLGSTVLCNAAALQGDATAPQSNAVP